MGRILALDLGKKRIGLALSDPAGLTAQGLPTLIRKNRPADLEALSRAIEEHEVKRVIVGHPLNMNGTAGPQARQAEQFARTLAKHCRVEVELWDERLSTREAARVLRDSGMGIEKRQAAVDRLAAVLILQSYLDSAAAGN